MGKAVVFGHHDVHGVCATALAAHSWGTEEVYSDYPCTSPESVIEYMRNMVVAAPSRLTIVMVDIPVNLKDPMGFVEGLDKIAELHDVIYVDHHESSLRFLHLFRRVKVTFVGPSSLVMNLSLAGEEGVYRKIAIVGAVGDRDPEVIRRGLLDEEVRMISDGLDYMIRRPHGAMKVAKSLVENPEGTLREAMEHAGAIPMAPLLRVEGCVAIASEVPSNWGPKALERLAFSEGTIYAVGPEYSERLGQWVVRAIARWDEVARSPHLPLPGEVAKELFPTRGIIGHPSAPSIAAVSREEAEEMSRRLASALNEARYGALTPRTQRFLNESSVGRVLVEILDEMRRMYREYLRLKEEQVRLLRRMEEARAD